jgi:hypothetical protein
MQRRAESLVRDEVSLRWASNLVQGDEGVPILQTFVLSGHEIFMLSDGD